MTALSAPRATRSKYNAGDRYRVFPVATGETIYPGAIVVVVDGEAYAAAAALDGAVAGWADLDTTPEAGATPTSVNALGTGNVKVCEGEAWYVNGATIATTDIAGTDAEAFADDDQTVGTTRGDEKRVGPILDVDATLGVLVGINFRDNIDYEGRPRIQSGTVTLAAGTVTLATGITVKATSRIHLTWEDAAADITHANTGGTLTVISKTAGAPGTGAFTVNTVDGAGALDNTGAGVVAYSIIDDTNL